MGLGESTRIPRVPGAIAVTSILPGPQDMVGRVGVRTNVAITYSARTAAHVKPKKVTHKTSIRRLLVKQDLVMTILLSALQFEPVWSRQDLGVGRVTLREGGRRLSLRKPSRVRYRRRLAERASASTAVARSARVAAGGFRICVDRDLCQGHAACVAEAPGVFELEPAEHKVRLLVDAPPAEFREAVDRAVRQCPTRALWIEEQSSRKPSPVSEPG